MLVLPPLRFGMEIYMELLIIIFGLPLVSLIWFIFDLVLFLRCPKGEKEKRGRYRNQLIISGILAFVFIGGVGLLMYWFSQAMEHM